MKPVFADSFYFLALFNPHDSAHDQAVLAAGLLKGSLVTTDWVLTEVADALCDASNRKACANLINDLLASPSIEIVPANRSLFDAGWTLYQSRPDKSWSMTDCISFVVMQEKGITEALTGDHHFEQAGFVASLRVHRA